MVKPDAAYVPLGQNWSEVRILSLVLKSAGRPDVRLSATAVDGVVYVPSVIAARSSWYNGRPALVDVKLTKRQRTALAKTMELMHSLDGLETGRV